MSLKTVCESHSLVKNGVYRPTQTHTHQHGVITSLSCFHCKLQPEAESHNTAPKTFNLHLTEQHYRNLNLLLKVNLEGLQKKKKETTSNEKI